MKGKIRYADIWYIDGLAAYYMWERTFNLISFWQSLSTTDIP